MSHLFVDNPGLVNLVGGGGGGSITGQITPSSIRFPLFVGSINHSFGGRSRAGGSVYLFDSNGLIINFNTPSFTRFSNSTVDFDKYGNFYGVVGVQNSSGLFRESSSYLLQGFANQRKVNDSFLQSDRGNSIQTIVDPEGLFSWMIVEELDSNFEPNGSGKLRRFDWINEFETTITNDTGGLLFNHNDDGVFLFKQNNVIRRIGSNSYQVQVSSLGGNASTKSVGVDNNSNLYYAIEDSSSASIILSLHKLDANGNLVFSKTINTAPIEARGGASLVDNNNNIYFQYRLEDTNSNRTYFIDKYDDQLNVVWSLDVTEFNGINVEKGQVDKEGFIYFTERLLDYNANSGLFRIDPDGPVIEKLSESTLFSELGTIKVIEVPPSWEPQAVGVNNGVGIPSTDITGAGIDDTNRILIIADSVSNQLQQYQIDNPWDNNTVPTLTHSFDVTPFVGTFNQSHIFFINKFGTEIYLSGNTDGITVVKQFSLAIPWDLSSIVSTGNQYDFASEDTGIMTMYIDPTGLIMIAADTNAEQFYRYDLTQPWDISTTSLTQIATLSGQSFSDSHIFFKDDGSKFFVRNTSTSNKVIISFDLLTPWDMSSFSNQKPAPITNFNNIEKTLYFANDGRIILITGGDFIALARGFDLARL